MKEGNKRIKNGRLTLRENLLNPVYLAPYIGFPYPYMVNSTPYTEIYEFKIGLDWIHYLDGFPPFFHAENVYFYLYYVCSNF